jgi:hypothetical protein
MEPHRKKPLFDKSEHEWQHITQSARGAREREEQVSVVGEQGSRLQEHPTLQSEKQPLGAAYAGHRRKPVRATNACDSCRQQKVQCDETRPHCSHCKQNKLECSYNPLLAPSGNGSHGGDISSKTVLIQPWRPVTNAKAASRASTPGIQPIDHADKNDHGPSKGSPILRRGGPFLKDTDPVSSLDNSNAPPDDPKTASIDTSGHPPVRGAGSLLIEQSDPSIRIRQFPILGAQPAETVDFNNDMSDSKPDDGISSLLTSSSASGGNDATQGDEMDDRIVHLCGAVLVRMYIRMVYQWARTKSGLTTQAGSNPQEGQSSTSRASQGSAADATNGKRKRSATGDGFHGSRSKNEHKRQAMGAGETLPLLACSFNKYDHRLFGPQSPNPSYHICATCSFTNIGYLK